MKMIANPVGRNSNTLVMEHNGETLSWNMKRFTRSPINENVVCDINEYWSRLPQDSQDAVWKIYKDIMDLFFYSPYELLTERLSEKIVELYQYHDFDVIQNYVLNEAGVTVFDTILDKPEVGRNAETTYCINEFYGLLALIIYLRPLLPILSEYTIVLDTKFPAPFVIHNAVRIIGATKIVQCEPYRHLRNYVFSFWKGKSATPTSSAPALAGLGDTEVPEWILTNVIFKPLLVFPILHGGASNETQFNPVVKLYWAVKTWTDDHHKQFDGITTKTAGGAGIGDENDKTSIAEHYKITSDVSESTVETHEVFSLNTLSVAKKQDETCPVEIVNAAIANQEQFPVNISETHITLMQWVLSETIAVDSTSYISYDALASLNAVCSSMLFHWGFPKLALISLSAPVDDVDVNVRTVMTKSSLNRDLQNKLESVYSNLSYYVNPKANKKRSNPIIEDIESYADSFGYTNWSYTVTPEIYEYLKDCNSHSFVLPKECNGLFLIPHDIADELAKLILFKEERYGK